MEYLLKNVLDDNGIEYDYKFGAKDRLVDSCDIRIAEPAPADKETPFVVKTQNPFGDINLAINDAALLYFMEFGFDAQLFSPYAVVEAQAGVADYDIKCPMCGEKLAEIRSGLVKKYDMDDITIDNVIAFQLLGYLVIFRDEIIIY